MQGKKGVGKMKLWTIKTTEDYEEFKENKILAGDIKYIRSYHSAA